MSSPALLDLVHTRTRNQQQQSVTSGLMSSEHQPGSYLSVTPMGVGSAQNSISPQSDGARTNRRTVTDYNSRKNPVIVLSDDLPGAPSSALLFAVIPNPTPTSAFYSTGRTACLDLHLVQVLTIRQPSTRKLQ